MDLTVGQMQPVQRQTVQQLDIFYCQERATTRFGFSIKPSKRIGRKIKYKTSMVHLFLYSSIRLRFFTLPSRPSSVF